eukprot:1140783-Pelagomonas_calceolata.AAC.5
MSQTLFLSRGGSVAVGNHAARRCRHSSVRAQTSNPPSPLAPSSLLPSSQHRALSQRHHGQRRGGRERLYVAAAGGNLVSVRICIGEGSRVPAFRRSAHALIATSAAARVNLAASLRSAHLQTCGHKISGKRPKPYHYYLQAGTKRGAGDA